MPRSSGARGVTLLAGVFVGIVLAAASPAPAARTLLYWPTQIRAFAQDGPHVTWIARAPNTVGVTCGRTYVRSLASGRQRAFGTKERPVCVGLGTPGNLALGRDRALWRAAPIPSFCGNCIPEGVYTAALGDPQVVRLGTFVYLDGGRQVTGLAADWGVHVFSWVRYDLLEQPDCLNEPVLCQYDVTGGHVTRVQGRDRYVVPGVAAAALLAAGPGFIAVAPSADPWESFAEDPQPAENGPVEVRDPDTGTLVMSVSPAGTVRALALSAGALAVLVEQTDGSLAIERYAVPAGTLTASTPVDANAAFEELDIAGKWIVYRVRRQIRIVDDLGGDHLLFEAPTQPIGVSIEGRRVAWAENIGGTHRIRAALAPS